MRSLPESPLVSVVVPTRNRHEYLAVLVRSMCAMQSEAFELLVHDNSSAPGGFEAACGTVTDPRVRYVYEPAPMSITENFERAVSLARGEYVCMIGDDDGVTESIVALARWLRTRHIDAAVVRVPTYLWPGVASKLDGSQDGGVLSLPRYSSRIDLIDSASALDAVLLSGGIRIGDLPSVYQGVISRRALNRLRDLTGTYFPGPSPDMANAVGLSAVVDRFARVSFPVVISGSCPVSGAAEGARHRHEGEIAAKKFLPPGTAETWPPRVPFYFSGPTLWAATLVHALDRTGRAEVAERLRWDRLYGACVVLNPRWRERVTEARARNPGLVSRPGLATAITWIWALRARALAGNLGRRAASMLRGGAHVSGLSDIGQVITHVTRAFGVLPTGGQRPG